MSSRVTIATIVIGVVAAFLIGRVTAPQKTVSLSDAGIPGPATGTDCTVKEGKSTVQGDSLTGVIESGSEIKVLENYYACKPGERGDIVLYRYAGNPNPLLKIVKGVSGDRFGLQKSGSGWNIMVNGDAVENSKGMPYVIGESGYRVLSLYVNDYKGVIPPDAYLILGEDPSGSLDSTKFGLVGAADFIGKVSR